MSDDKEQRRFNATVPIMPKAARSEHAPDPARTKLAFAPNPAQLDELRERVPSSVQDRPTRATPSRRQIRESLPPKAPTWMESARSLSLALEAMVTRGKASPLEQAAVARLRAAWTLGGVTENHILRVAHLVARAHRAIRETKRAALEDGIRDCAGVLHAGLPSEVRRRLPIERAIDVVRELRDTPDPWPAVVEATMQLLGWTEQGRYHAAALIRGVLEGSMTDRDGNG